MEKIMANKIKTTFLASASSTNFVRQSPQGILVEWPSSWVSTLSLVTAPFFLSNFF